MNLPRRAVFLDRDGVLNRKAPEGSYIATLDQFELLPGALEAVAEFGRAGYLVIVVTNQRGVARGLVTLADLECIHDRLRARTLEAGGQIDHIYICPHDYSDNCECRKPHPGMILQAARDYCLELADSWVIGDSASDIEAGQRAGCRTICVGTNCSAKAHYTVAALEEAVGLVLAGREMSDWQASSR